MRERPPHEEPRLTHLTRLWAISFGVATFLGVASGAFVYFGMMSMGHGVAFPHALREGFTDWYFWALLCPLVFLIALRLRIDRRRWLVAAALHLVVGSAVAVAEIGITALVTRWLAPQPGVPSGLSSPRSRRRRGIYSPVLVAGHEARRAKSLAAARDDRRLSLGMTESCRSG